MILYLNVSLNSSLSDKILIKHIKMDAKKSSHSTCSSIRVVGVLTRRILMTLRAASMLITCEISEGPQKYSNICLKTAKL